MEHRFYKTAGVSLIVGATLAIVTMILHPVGGNLHHLIKIAQPIIFAHTLALSCLPFILFGFYGLSQRLSDPRKLTLLAFIIIAFGLFAAMLAGMFNGLVLPRFLGKYAHNLEAHQSVLKPIVSYGFAINTALDYVFIVATCASIAVYSFVIVRLRQLPVWLGYWGIAILLLAILGATTNFVFTNLLGFRIFIFSIASWFLAAGILLIKQQPDIQKGFLIKNENFNI